MARKNASPRKPQATKQPKYEAAKKPELLRMSKVELLELGTKPAKDELARRQRNRAAKRAAAGK